MDIRQWPKPRRRNGGVHTTHVNLLNLRPQEHYFHPHKLPRGTFLTLSKRPTPLRATSFPSPLRSPLPGESLPAARHLPAVPRLPCTGGAGHSAPERPPPVVAAAHADALLLVVGAALLLGGAQGVRPAGGQAGAAQLEVGVPRGSFRDDPHPGKEDQRCVRAPGGDSAVLLCIDASLVAQSTSLSFTVAQLLEPRAEG